MLKINSSPSCQNVVLARGFRVCRPSSVLHEKFTWVLKRSSIATFATNSKEEKKGGLPPSEAVQLNDKGNEKDEGKLPDGPITRLIALLGKYEATRWLAGLAQRFITESMTQSGDPKMARILRGAFLVGIIFAAALFRQQPVSVKPREVRSIVNEWKIVDHALGTDLSQQ